MANPLFTSTPNSPTRTTRPTKAVNITGTSVKLTHNTFDNSFFLFTTQRYGLYHPFWWKECVAGDNEPFSNSHNVRSLPYASPILSPMKLNKDYFQVPKYAIQPNTWDYIFKTPTQGDDVPFGAQNLFPFVDPRSIDASARSPRILLQKLLDVYSNSDPDPSNGPLFLLMLLTCENFFSSGSLLYNMGYKLNPVFVLEDDTRISFDELFDLLINSIDITVSINIDDPDQPTGNRIVSFSTIVGNDDVDFVVPRFTIISLMRSFYSDINSLEVDNLFFNGNISLDWDFVAVSGESPNLDPLDCIRLDTIVAYQLACSQYYVNPRVDFLYNAQLYRDNYIQLLRTAQSVVTGDPIVLNSFDYNGIPVLYDYFSLNYHEYASAFLFDSFSGAIDQFYDLQQFIKLTSPIFYLFGYREQLRFGNYFTDSRTQALGYGEPGSDAVAVFDDSVSVTDLSQKLVLNRFRSAVAHLDNSSEDYLETMFGETLPPDYHFPKFIAHSEFGIAGDEVNNTSSDNQGNIVTNLKSGQDTAEFNIDISVPSILIGISYVSVPELYCQSKERAYFHGDRYDMFQPMLQYFGDQEIYNREVSDTIPNPADSYAYVSRNGEYKQRLSQVAGAFLTSLRSWVFTVDLPGFAETSPRLANTQSPVAIRAHDFEFNRFLAVQTGVSLGTGFHFIMQYNNQNVDNRPMDVNPLPLYPNNSL